MFADVRLVFLIDQRHFEQRGEVWREGAGRENKEEMSPSFIHRENKYVAGG